MLVRQRAPSAPHIAVPHLKAIRFKTTDIAEDGTFEGYGSIFNTVDTYGDIVLPGCFAESLKRHAEAGTRPKGLWQHDPALPIITWLELAEDRTGLRCKGKLLLEVEKAREAYALMKAGEIDGLSIGYETVEEEFIAPSEVKALLGFEADGQPGYDGRYRLLKSCDLWEISAVTFPACKPSKIDAVKHAPPIVTEQPGLLLLRAALAERQRLLAGL